MRRKKSSKSSEEKNSASRLSKLKKALPKVKPGTPEPLIWAASGALIGMGISLGSAAMNDTVEHNLLFLGMFLEKLLQFFPIGMAGALIGAFVALGWFGCRR
jgi:hypothetical protein